jgi:hypothetical protein
MQHEAGGGARVMTDVCTQDAYSYILAIIKAQNSTDRQMWVVYRKNQYTGTDHTEPQCDTVYQ